MKTLILILAVTAGLSQASAATMNCTIKEGGSQVRETKVQHDYDETSSHSFTQFDSAYAKGFVAVSRDYGVVNIVSKENGRANSFYGKIGGGNVVGGNISMGPDGKDWFSVECQ